MMQSLGRLSISASAILLAGSLLGGCIVTPAPRYYYRPAAVVTIPPPAPEVEVVGAAPTPGYVWFGGYWRWVDGRHVWVGGHWGPGRAGYYWVPHEWVRVGGGWRMVDGHWAVR